MVVDRKEIRELIQSNDIEAIRDLFARGWDPNYTDEIRTPGVPKHLPINEVIESKNLPMLQLFVENGAELNFKGEPTAVVAAQWSTTEILKYLVEHGADIQAMDYVKKSVLDGALYQRNPDISLEMLKTAVELGVDIKVHGGKVLRSAAWKGRLPVVQYLLDVGADVNYKKSDSVFTNDPTALYESVSSNHYEVAELLIARGADITIADNRGQRPFQVAKKNKNQQLMDLIAKHEPAELHQLDQCIAKLKKEGLPTKLIKFLGTENKRIDLPKSLRTEYIEFNTLQEVTVFEYGGFKLLDLLKDVEGYGGTTMLMWCPAKKCFATLDEEHDAFGFINFTWEAFLKNAGRVMDDILEGTYAEEQSE